MLSFFSNSPKKISIAATPTPTGADKGSSDDAECDAGEVKLFGKGLQCIAESEKLKSGRGEETIEEFVKRNKEVI